MFRESNFLLWNKDTKMLVSDDVAPRLIAAIADFTPLQREKILTRQFFNDPCEAIYSYGCLIKAANNSKRLNELSRSSRQQVEVMKRDVQDTLVRLIEFLDHPIKEEENASTAKYVPVQTLLERVLNTQAGWLALRQLADADCREVLGSEVLEPFIRRQFRGSLLFQLLEVHTDSKGRQFSWRRYLTRWMTFLLVTVINFAVSPILALVLFLPCFHRSAWEDSCAKTLYTGAGKVDKNAVLKFFPWPLFQLGDNSNELKPALQWLPPALYVLEEPWAEGMLRSTMELAQVVSLASLRLMPNTLFSLFGVEISAITFNFVWAIVSRHFPCLARLSAFMMPCSAHSH